MAAITNVRDVLLQLADPRMVNLDVPFPQLNGFRNGSFKKGLVAYTSGLPGYVDHWTNYCPAPTSTPILWSTLGGYDDDYCAQIFSTSGPGEWGIGQDPEEGWQEHTYYIIHFRARLHPGGINDGVGGLTFRWGTAGGTNFTEPTLIKSTNPTITRSWQQYSLFFKFDNIDVSGSRVPPTFRIMLNSASINQASSPGYFQIDNAMLQKGTVMLPFSPALNEIQGLSIDTNHIDDDAVSDNLSLTTTFAYISNSLAYSEVMQLNYTAQHNCTLVCSLTGSTESIQFASPGTVLVDIMSWYIEVEGVAGSIFNVPGNTDLNFPYDMNFAGTDYFAVSAGQSVTVRWMAKAQSNKYNARVDFAKLLVEVKKK